MGTSLYVAPEVDRATRHGTSSEESGAAYDQKVDMYSLGIILCELLHPAFSTESERVLAIQALRRANIQLPVALENDPALENEARVLVYEYILHLRAQ